MSALQCPDCGIEMQVQRYYGISVDVCPACAGIWFDESELRQLMQLDPLILLSLEDRAVPDVVYTPSETVNRRCPRCGIQLHPYRYMYDTPIELDGCDGCHGFWVEDGELRRIHEEIQARRSPQPDDEERHRLAVAQYARESQERVDRANMLSSLFSLLRKRVPPFAGFGQ